MKYQLTCPRCKYEFQYDNGYYDKAIAGLQAEISEMSAYLKEYKTWSVQKKRDYSEWRHQIILRQEKKMQELRELRELRKLYDQQLEHQQYKVFKELVKEKYGNDVYHSLLEETMKMLEAYKISDMMKVNYTRADGKKVISSGKL